MYEFFILCGVVLVLCFTVLALMCVFRKQLRGGRKTRALRKTLQCAFSNIVPVEDDNIICVGYSKLGYSRRDEIYCPVCGSSCKGKYYSRLGEGERRTSALCLNCKHEVSQFVDHMLVAHRGKRVPGVCDVIKAVANPKRLQTDKEE